MLKSNYAVIKYSKRWILACNLAIVMAALIAIAIGLFVCFAYRDIKNLKETTGKISGFKQYDADFTDAIVGRGSHFNVTLQDGTFFEAKGIAYDNIDRALFEKISVGEEITLTYSHGVTRPNRIYAIEYGGKEYLSVEVVLPLYEKKDGSSTVTGAVIIALSGASAIAGLAVVNCRYSKKKQTTE